MKRRTLFLLSFVVWAIFSISAAPLFGQGERRDVPAAPSVSADSYLRAARLGINHISGSNMPVSDERYTQALALGAGWNRWALYWNEVEPRAGFYDWRDYDALVTSDLDAGLQTNVILLGIPRNHRDGDSIRGLHEPIYTDGTDTPGTGKRINARNPFADFVYRAVSRYMPSGTLARELGWSADRGIRVWEVWNEPDFTPFWEGGVVDYARMLKVAYIVAHAVDPEATVMFGGLLYPTSDNFFAEVLRIIAEDPERETYNWYFDAVGVHSYTDAWRSGWLTLYTRQTMVEFGIQRPIWLNESGAPVWDDYPGPTWLTEQRDASERRDRLTMQEQADYFIQSAAWAFAEGADVVFMFQLYDDCGNQPAGTNFTPHDGSLCEDEEPCFGDAFGLYSNPENAVCFAHHPRPDTARPAAEAYRLAAEIFGTQPFSPRGVIDTVTREGVVIITFSRPESDERIVVMWNTLPIPVRLPLDAMSDSAALYTLDTRETITPTPGILQPQYVLTLPPRTSDRPLPEDESVLPNGGSPLILIERLPNAESINLQVQTQVLPPSAAIALPPTPIPQLGMSAEVLEALLAASPTGAIFTATEHARLRTAPSTETSQVLGTMAPLNSASLLGRLEDSSWYMIDSAYGQVWVAGFLGQVSGDMASVPIIVLETVPTDTTPEAASGE